MVSNKDYKKGRGLWLFRIQDQFKITHEVLHRKNLIRPKPSKSLSERRILVVSNKEQFATAELLLVFIKLTGRIVQYILLEDG
jgi:hypothetical protein